LVIRLVFFIICPENQIFKIDKGKPMASKKNTRKSPRKSFPAWAWLLIAAAAVGIVYLVLQQGDASTEKLPRAVSVAEAAALREEGALILDVREQSEWEQGHIEGATLIPLGQLFQRSAELPTDQTIVVVCRSGNRSAQGRDILETAGFTTVTSMNGGMNDWQAQGYPIVTGP